MADNFSLLPFLGAQLQTGDNVVKGFEMGAKLGQAKQTLELQQAQIRNMSEDNLRQYMGDAIKKDAPIGAKKNSAAMAYRIFKRLNPNSNIKMDDMLGFVNHDEAAPLLGSYLAELENSSLPADIKRSKKMAALASLDQYYIPSADDPNKNVFDSRKYVEDLSLSRKENTDLEKINLSNQGKVDASLAASNDKFSRKSADVLSDQVIKTTNDLRALSNKAPGFVPNGVIDSLSSVLSTINANDWQKGQEAFRAMQSKITEVSNKAYEAANLQESLQKLADKATGGLDAKTSARISAPINPQNFNQKKALYEDLLTQESTIKRQELDEKNRKTLASEIKVFSDDFYMLKDATAKLDEGLKSGTSVWNKVILGALQPIIEGKNSVIRPEELRTTGFSRNVWDALMIKVRNLDPSQEGINLTPNELGELKKFNAFIKEKGADTYFRQLTPKIKAAKSLGVDAEQLLPPEDINAFSLWQKDKLKQRSNKKGESLPKKSTEMLYKGKVTPDEKTSKIGTPNNLNMSSWKPMPLPNMGSGAVPIEYIKNTWYKDFSKNAPAKYGNDYKKVASSVLKKMYPNINDVQLKQVIGE